MRRHLGLRLLATTTALCAPALAFAQQALPAPKPTADAEYRANWGLGAINALTAYQMGLTGKGVTVAVIDSGLDVRHPEFTGRVSADALNLGDDQSLSNVMPTIGEDGEIAGHGTHVAGIIGAARNGVGMQGVAYNSTILPIRAVGIEPIVPDTDPTNTAIRYAAEAGAKVINGSYGPPTLGMLLTDADGQPVIIDGNYVIQPNYTVLQYQPLYDSVENLIDTHDALKEAADKDVVLVFSAGNEYAEQPIASSIPDGNGMLPLITPENLQSGALRIISNAGAEGFDIDDESTYEFLDPSDPSVRNLDFSDLKGTLIAVVAVDKNGEISSYSNRCGAAADWCLAAPGGDMNTGADDGIYSTWPDAEDPSAATYQNDQGTSMAAPHVAGAAAVVREAFPYMTAGQTIETILTTATDMGDPEIYGQGMLNLGAAVNGPGEFRYDGVFDVDTKGTVSVWANDISGVGDLVKRGEGALILTGANTYTGPTTVLGGTLAVDGSNVSPTWVAGGGILAGIGSVGDLTAGGDGTVSPGSILDVDRVTATLGVNGDFLQGAGSVYVAGIAGATTSDRIAVSGETTISALAEMTVVRESADDLKVNTRYTVLTSADGVSGSYGSVSARFLDGMDFVEVALAYDPTSVFLDLQRSAVAFADVTTTGNQRAVAIAAETLMASGALYNDLAFMTAPEARTAFTQLSGEIHASAESVLIGQSHFVRDAATERVRAAFAGVAATAAPVTELGADGPVPAAVSSEKLSIWGRGFGAWGTLDGDGNAASVSSTIGGFLAGADLPIGDLWRAGVLAGYSRTSFGINARSSSGSSESYHAGLYGGADWNRIGLRTGLAYSWNSLSTDRNVSLPGGGETLSADYDAGTFQMFGELGYRWDMAPVSFEPFANAAYVHLDTDSFQETGGVAALSGAGESTDTGFTTLGLRAASTLGVGPVPVTLKAEAGWIHAYGDVTPESTLSFASGSSAFDVQGAPIARDAAALSAGVDVTLAKSATLGLSYQGQLASDAEEHGLNGRLSIRF
ncbi:autotransporter domain-containing protein [Segnochrobactraceae bacterium EtOH-i3]